MSCSLSSSNGVKMEHDVSTDNAHDDEMDLISTTRSESSLAASRHRRPFCAQCTNHGHRVDLKGHKRFCPFKACHCSKCMVTIERRKINAKQIAIRREITDCSPYLAPVTASRNQLYNLMPGETKVGNDFNLDENTMFLKSFLELVYPRRDLTSLLLRSFLRAHDGDVNKTLVQLRLEADKTVAQL